MRITHEADYAIRVAFCLAECGGKLGAKEISERTGVTLRFALKILRKLIQAGMVRSYKGANGETKYSDIAFAITDSARHSIEDAVIGAYREALGESEDESPTQSM